MGLPASTVGLEISLCLIEISNFGKRSEIFLGLKRSSADCKNEEVLGLSKASEFFPAVADPGGGVR